MIIIFLFILYIYYMEYYSITYQSPNYNRNIFRIVYQLNFFQFKNNFGLNILPLFLTSLLIISNFIWIYNTVPSFNYYDITTKIAFTKNQLSPDNSWISLCPISSKNSATFTCSVWYLNWTRSSGFGSYINNYYLYLIYWNSRFIYEFFYNSCY